MKPIISIILTTFNASPHISEVLQSIIGQKGKGKLFELDIIVIDDCSTDNTLEILQTFEIQVYSNRVNSGGPNKGRNLGLSLAKGEWVIIADHDDCWMEDRISSTIVHLDKADILSCGYEIHDESRNKKRVTGIKEDQRFYLKNETFLKLLSKNNKKQTTFLSALCFKNMKVPQFEEQYGQVDFDFILKLFQDKTSFHIGKALYIRKQHKSNLSREEQYRKHDFEIAKQSLKAFESEYPAQVKEGIRGLHGTLARFYYSKNMMKKCRYELLRSKVEPKTLLYYITSFVGSSLVNRNFRVFD